MTVLVEGGGGQEEGAKNAATIKLQQAVARVRYEDWCAVRNEINTLRGYMWCFKSDADLVRELLELREFRDRHPLPAFDKPAAQERPSSSIIKHAEAKALFGEYCDREASRLGAKACLMEAGLFSEVARMTDTSDCARHDRIAKAAVALEANAIDAWVHERNSRPLGVLFAHPTQEPHHG